MDMEFTSAILHEIATFSTSDKKPTVDLTTSFQGKSKFTVHRGADPTSSSGKTAYLKGDVIRNSYYIKDSRELD